MRQHAVAAFWFAMLLMIVPPQQAFARTVSGAVPEMPLGYEEITPVSYLEFCSRQPVDCVRDSGGSHSVGARVDAIQAMARWLLSRVQAILPVARTMMLCFADDGDERPTSGRGELLAQE